MHMMVLIIITTMIATLEMVIPEATDLATVKAVDDNFRAATLEAEAKDPNITFKIRDNFKTKDITGTIIKVTTIPN